MTTCEIQKPKAVCCLLLGIGLAESEIVIKGDRWLLSVEMYQSLYDNFCYTWDCEFLWDHKSGWGALCMMHIALDRYSLSVVSVIIVDFMASKLYIDKNNQWVIILKVLPGPLRKVVSSWLVVKQNLSPHQPNLRCLKATASPKVIILQQIHIALSVD